MDERSVAQHFLKRIAGRGDFFEESDQTTKPNLFIFMSGLGVTQNTGHSWQTVFLDGIPNHPLRVEIDKEINGQSKTDFFWIGHDKEPGRNISVTLPGVGNSTDVVLDGTEFSIHNLLDFSSNDLHGPHPVKIVSPKCISLTKFEVAGGKGFTAEMSPPDYGGGPNYYLLRPGESPQYATKFNLGTWLGIAYNIAPGTNGRIVIDSKQNPEHYDFEFAENVVHKVCIHNHCADNVNEVDFPYYYSFGHKGTNGIIDMPPIQMVYVGKKLTSKVAGRVDCNMMRLSNIADGKSLFDIA